MHSLLDLGGDVPYVVHDKDFDTAVHAVVERVFLRKGENGLEPPPEPTTLHDLDLIEIFHTLGSTTHTGPPMTDSQFLDCYGGRRRVVYEQAVKSLYVKPISRADAFIDFFVKAEKADAGAKIPVPRAIQPRAPRYNVCVGKYLKPREHDVYRAIDRMWANGASVVCKGKNAVERASILRERWESLTDPVAVFLDVSRFDQHVSYMALKLEHLVYERLYPGDETLRELLKWQLVNRGFFRSRAGKFKYKVRGRRMSGDMNTAMGNVILMCCMMLHWVRRSGVRATIADDGDDCCLFVERADLALVEGGPCPIIPFFKGMGFTLKVEGSTDVFERIIFCQSQPVYDGERWVMVRGLHCLDKDRLSVYPVIGEKHWAQLRAAIAGCGLALAGNMPVFGAYYDMLGRGVTPTRSDVLNTGMDYLARGMKGVRREPTSECRLSFWRAFGIVPEVQRAIEEVYDSTTVDYCVIRPDEDKTKDSYLIVPEAIDYLRSSKRE